MLSRVWRTFLTTQERQIPVSPSSQNAGGSAGHPRKRRLALWLLLLILSLAGVYVAIAAALPEPDREFEEFTGLIGKWSADSETVYWLGDSVPQSVLHEFPNMQSVSAADAEKILGSDEHELVAGPYSAVWEDLEEMRRRALDSGIDEPLCFRSGPWGLAVSRGYTEYVHHVPVTPLPPRKSVRIAALGDTGDAGPREFRTGSALAGIADSLDGILLLGDNFYWNAEYFERASDAFSAAFEMPFAGCLAKGVPFHAVLGNHDGDLALLELDYPPFRMHGRRYYSVSFGDGVIDAFLLDSESLQDGDAQQVKWLREGLSESDASWKLVLLHHPLLTVADDHKGDTRILKALRPLLREFSVTAVLSGHSHLYARRQSEDEWQQIVAGSGGKLRDKANPDPRDIISYQKNNVFVVIDASENSLEVYALTPGGDIVDHAVLGGSDETQKRV